MPALAVVSPMGPNQNGRGVRGRFHFPSLHLLQKVGLRVNHSFAPLSNSGFGIQTWPHLSQVHSSASILTIRIAIGSNLLTTGLDFTRNCKRGQLQPTEGPNGNPQSFVERHQGRPASA